MLVALLWASVGQASPVPSRGPRRVGKVRLQLPIVRQATDYSCGAASLLSVLQRFSGYGGSERSLYRGLGTEPKHGTRPERIAKVAKRHGLSATFRDGLSISDLRRAVKKGQAVILDLQAWRSPRQQKSDWSKIWGTGHYVVLESIGTKYATFMDPWAPGKLAWAPIAELDKRWHDWTHEKDGSRRKWQHSAIIVDAPARLAKGRNAKPALDAAKLQKRLPKQASGGFGLVRME